MSGNQYSYNTGFADFDFSEYPTLEKYAKELKPLDSPLIGRTHEASIILSTFHNPVVSNVLLLGDAGSGKTTLARGVAGADPTRMYLELELGLMTRSDNGEDGSLQLVSRLTEFFKELGVYKKDMEASNDKNAAGKELIVFIDEFHQLFKMSDTAVQTIKPLLMDGPSEGVRVLAATTFGEFDRIISHDDALIERFLRLPLHEPDNETVVTMLRSMVESQDLVSDVLDDSLYELIVEYTNRYMPAQSQPRKSIVTLGSMIGAYRFNRSNKLDKQSLARVIRDSVGVNVNFSVDGRAIERSLNRRVFAQKYAAKKIEERLQTVVADLHDKTKPMSSFLFTGPTGTGKTEMAKALANVLFDDERNMIRFDMSEYKEESAVTLFRESLTKQIWETPHTIVLIDEIEKANPAVTRLLLQVLDDATLKNKNGRSVPFNNCYIIMTTNAGSDVYKDMAHYSSDDMTENGMAEYSKVILKSLEGNETFPTELLNRIDAVISFGPLSTETMRAIVNRQLGGLIKDVYKKHGVQLAIVDDTLKFLIEELYDVDTNSGGARGVKRRTETHVISAVSRYINIHKHVKSVGVRIIGDMSVDDESLLKGNASVQVFTN